MVSGSEMMLAENPNLEKRNTTEKIKIEIIRINRIVMIFNERRNQKRG